jgi:hypothetical protein
MKKRSIVTFICKKIVRAAKRFFEWVSVHKKGYKAITPHFLDTLRVPKMDIGPKEREYVSYQEILDIAKAEASTTRD